MGSLQKKKKKKKKKKLLKSILKRRAHLILHRVLREMFYK